MNRRNRLVIGLRDSIISMGCAPGLLNKLIHRDVSRYHPSYFSPSFQMLVDSRGSIVLAAAANS